MKTVFDYSLESLFSLIYSFIQALDPGPTKSYLSYAPKAIRTLFIIHHSSLVYLMKDNKFFVTLLLNYVLN